MKRLHYPEIDSTNEEAKRLFLSGSLVGPAYLLADSQTAGKGTQGRTWVSPPGAGIYLSVVHPAFGNDIPMTTCFTLAAGVACVEALHEMLGLTVQLKPVNDLYIEGKKLGGILAETLVQEGKIRALITGVGLNVKHVERVLDKAAAMPVSLEELLPPHQFERLDYPELCDALAAKIDHWHGLVFARRTGEVERAWKSHQLPNTRLTPGC